MIHVNLSKKAISRLTALADYLDKLPPKLKEKFDMDTWFDHRGDDDHGFKAGQPVTVKELKLCGTTACAMGWAGTMPAFKKAGLRMTFDGDGSFTTFYFQGESFEGGGIFDLISSFFDLDLEQAEFLFGDQKGNHLTVKEWIKGARYFVQTDGLCHRNVPR